MILRLVALWFLALAATAGCARKNDSVTGPPPALPPEISAVSPPDRSLRLVGEPSIWVRFALPMDSTSLNARTVFLLHDTNRIPMHLAWAPDSLTLHLQPLAALRLGWTYTIQLRPGVRSASGATFERPFESQFSMLSVRVPADALPGSGPSVRPGRPATSSTRATTREPSPYGRSRRS